MSFILLQYKFYYSLACINSNIQRLDRYKTFLIIVIKFKLSWRYMAVCSIIRDIGLQWLKTWKTSKEHSNVLTVAATHTSELVGNY